MIARNPWALLLFALCLSSVLAYASGPDSAALMQADRDFAKATTDRGLDGWMEYMAINAVLLRDEPLVGVDNIRLGMNKSFQTPGFKLTWDPTKAEFVGSGGDLGYTIGRYEVKFTGNDGKPQSDHGTYLTTWKKQKDGSWKVVSDIGTPDPKPQ